MRACYLCNRSIGFFETVYSIGNDKKKIICQECNSELSGCESLLEKDPQLYYSRKDELLTKYSNINENSESALKDWLDGWEKEYNSCNDSDREDALCVNSAKNKKSKKHNKEPDIYAFRKTSAIGIKLIAIIFFLISVITSLVVYFLVDEFIESRIAPLCAFVYFVLSLFPGMILMALSKIWQNTSDTTKLLQCLVNIEKSKIENKD